MKKVLCSIWRIYLYFLNKYQRWRETLSRFYMLAPQTVCDGCHRRARAHLLQSLAGQLEHAGLLGGLQVGLEGAVPHGVLPMTRLAATRLLRSSRAHPLKSLQVVKRRDSLSTTRSNQEQPGTSRNQQQQQAGLGCLPEWDCSLQHAPAVLSRRRKYPPTPPNNKRARRSPRAKLSD